MCQLHPSLTTAIHAKVDIFQKDVENLTPTYFLYHRWEIEKIVSYTRKRGKGESIKKPDEKSSADGKGRAEGRVF